MVVIGKFMFGFDTDIPDVFEKTLTAVKDLKIDVADFSILTPFPGTPLFHRLDDEKRILTKEWEYYDTGHVVFQPKQMSPDQLRNGVRWMYDAFYSPLYSLQRIFRSLRYGVYSFVVVFAQNLIAMISSRRVKS
jgi:radical SAM superfamily enzyme YgiQ (UPF0313 family)